MSEGKQEVTIISSNQNNESDKRDIPENLSFAGCGVKGLGYAGAIRAFEDMNFHPKRVAGTSAGAIAALGLSIGMNASEIEDILFNLDLKKFMDGNIFTKVKDISANGGVYKGDYFYNWIKGLLKNKFLDSETTFEELNKYAKQYNLPELYVTGYNLNTQSCELFSHENQPHMKVADAIRISMSIPFFFKPFVNDQTGHYYVDGGVGNNNPIETFDWTKYFAELNKELKNQHKINPKTLGLYMTNPKKIQAYREGKEPPVTVEINTGCDLLKAQVAALIEGGQSEELEVNYKRQLYIDNTGVGTVEFDISEERKLALIQMGYDTSIIYFKNYQLYHFPETFKPVNYFEEHKMKKNKAVSHNFNQMEASNDNKASSKVHDPSFTQTPRRICAIL